MDVTEKALRGSIEKWHNILHAHSEDRGGSNCPLCQLFLSHLGGSGGCEACPVTEGRDFKLSGCVEVTPYGEWDKHHSKKHRGEDKKRIWCSTCRELAQAEYDFLKDLLIDYLSTRAKLEGDYEMSAYLRGEGRGELEYKSADKSCGSCRYFVTYCSATHRNWCQYKHHSQTKNALCSKYACMEVKSAGKKKEEWEDITKEIRWKPYQFCIGKYWLDGIYQNYVIAYCSGSEIFISTHLKKKFKAEIKKPRLDTTKGTFRILKRV